MLNQFGYLSNVWDAWFREVFSRLGGSVAPSLTDVQTEVNNLENTVGTLEDRVSVVEGIGIGRQL
jgi:hypothetical protein